MIIKEYVGSLPKTKKKKTKKKGVQQDVTQKANDAEIKKNIQDK